ncbi:MAG: M1 family metallopeptidase [Flavobacteriales bacterium]|nr:M1 family metallopeptidase [Flavobacteriales bacterium]
MRTYTYFLLAGMLIASGCSTPREVADDELPLDEGVILLDPIEVVPEKTVYNASERKVNDLLHTRLDVRFDWQKQHLLGQATLQFKPYFYPTNRLLLDAKGFDIHRVALVTDTGYIDLDYTYDNRVLDITLDKKYSRIEKYQVFIDYKAKPNDLPIGGSNAITSDKGLYFINPDSSEVGKPTQLWTQGETESSSCWFPTIDSPNERMTQELFITTHKDFVTLSNGEHVYSNFNADGTKTDYWKMEQSHAPYLTMMAVGDFVVAHDKWVNSKGVEIPVNYYMEREYADFAYRIFGNTPEMIGFFSEVLGYEYPWNKYSQIIVRDYVSGAMENTTAVIHGEFLNATDRQLLDYDNEDVISHELFHHWFGDLVTCESWANLPLNESFATYGEYLWNEHKYGKDDADWHSYESLLGYFSEADFKRVDLIRYDYRDKEDMFDAHSYNKGGRILHMLRNIVGDEAFFEGMKTYLINNQYRDAEIHNLRLAFEQVTGMDLNWFFNQWFLSAGHPEVLISYNWNEAEGAMEVTIEQTQQTHISPIFRIPLTIDVYSGGKSTSHEVIVEEQVQTFSLPSTSGADWVSVDAAKYMLWEKEDLKPSSWYALQYREGKNLMDRFEALDFLLDNPQGETGAIIQEALNDPFWRMREMALEAIQDYPELVAASHDRIVQMLKDEKSLVRAAAVMTLANAPFAADHLADFEKAIKDPSYAVITAGLYGMVQVDANAGLAKAHEMETKGDHLLLLPLGNLYAQSGRAENLNFFRKNLSALNQGELYEFVNYYGEFLQRQDFNVVETGLGDLQDIARNASPWWVKFSGYQSLYGLVNRYAVEAEGIAIELENAQNVGGDVATIERLNKDLANAENRQNQIEQMIQSLHQGEKDPRIRQAFGE